MGQYKNIHVEFQDRVALLTIERPQVLNALNAETLSELKDCFTNLRESGEAGAVIITGAGEKAFVAGADIAELAQLDPLGARAKSDAGHALLHDVETFPKPVIAAINGFCLGGGCELALACHIRIASEDARLGLPEVKLGLIPGYGGTQRLPRLIGKGRALELILTGEMVDAAQAEKIGLVNHVVPRAELISHCHSLAGKILNNAPLAVRYSMEAIQSGLEMPLQEALSLEANLFALSFATDDMREGTTAFVEKRKARFEGK
ncbi:MAG: enoyl-CoA hydratase/isomerase family protein [Acidobacteriota bacterium]